MIYVIGVFAYHFIRNKNGSEIEPLRFILFLALVRGAVDGFGILV